MSSGPKTISIRKVSKDASNEEVDQIINVFNEAFATDEFTSYLVAGYNGHTKSPSFLPEHNRHSVLSALQGGQVYVAELANVGIVGAANWFGPGESFLACDVDRKNFMEKLTALDPDMQSYFDDYIFPKIMNHTTNLFPDPDTRLNAWHLGYLGVRPEYQRRGVGKALIMDCERRARDGSQSEFLVDANVKPENIRILLETESIAAREFYKKLGYDVKGEMEVHAPKSLGEDAGSITLWFMTKDL